MEQVGLVEPHSLSRHRMIDDTLRVLARVQEPIDPLDFEASFTCDSRELIWVLRLEDLRPRQVDTGMKPAFVDDPVLADPLAEILGERAEDAVVWCQRRLAA